MSADLPTFAHRDFNAERKKRERTAAKLRISLDEMGTMPLRARAQASAAVYLITRPTLFVVHRGRNYSRRGNLLDLFWSAW